MSALLTTQCAVGTKLVSEQDAPWVACCQHTEQVSEQDGVVCCTRADMQGCSLGSVLRARRYWSMSEMLAWRHAASLPKLVSAHGCSLCGVLKAHRHVGQHAVSTLVGSEHNFHWGACWKHATLIGERDARSVAC